MRLAQRLPKGVEAPSSLSSPPSLPSLLLILPLPLAHHCYSSVCARVCVFFSLLESVFFAATSKQTKEEGRKADKNTGYKEKTANQRNKTRTKAIKGESLVALQTQSTLFLFSFTFYFFFFFLNIAAHS